MSIVPKILIDKDEEMFSIHLVNCDVNFKGSVLAFAGSPSIFPNEGRDLLLVNRILEGNYLAPNSLILNLAHDKILKLHIDSCNLRIENSDIDFRGESISFENCIFDGDSPRLKISNTNIDFVLKGLDRGYFCISRVGLISAKNISISSPDGALEMIFDTASLAQFQYSHSTSISLIVGKIRYIKSNSPNFDFGSIGVCAIDLIEFNFVVDQQILLNKVDTVRGTKLQLNSNGSSFRIERVRVRELSFTNATIDELVCSNCDFSETHIQFISGASIDFEKFRSIATTWNEYGITVAGYRPKTPPKIDSNIQAAREFYSAFKMRFDRNGDNINAIKFHSAEMLAYLDLLKSNRLKLSDRISICLSYHSSEFGQNWGKALFWYLMIALLVDIIFLIGNGFLSLKEFNIFQFFIHFDLYLKIISPAEWLKSSFDDILNNTPRYVYFYQATWLCWKIAAAYLIFQIINATRKFVRKF